MPHICVYVMYLALDYCIWLTSHAFIGFGKIFSAEILNIYAIYCIVLRNAISNIARYITL